MSCAVQGEHSRQRPGKVCDSADAIERALKARRFQTAALNGWQVGSVKISGETSVLECEAAGEIMTGGV
jgi:hypothetical protein